MTLSPTRAGRRQLLLAAAASPLLFGVPRLLRAQDGPLKIALLTSLSGPFASLGESMRAGLELMLQQCNYEMGGRKVQLLVEDDHGKPDEAIRKVRKLIERDKIDILGGVISANIALAIRDIVHDAQLPTFISNAAANGLAREAASPYVFRPTKTSWMLGHTGALWTFEHIEKSGGITLGSDYTAGREYIEDFANTYQEQGGTLGERIWTPLGTPDFAPILMNLAASNPKFVYTFLAGADAVRFHQQMQDYQLHGKIQIVGPGALFDQEDVITAVGDAALGGVSTFHQSPGAPAAQDFVAAYQASRGRLPGEASTSGYVTGQVIKAGLDAVKGDLSNKAAFKQALLDKPINTAFGPMAFDPRNNQSILDIYVNRVEKDTQGRPFNTVVHTYQRIQDPGPAFLSHTLSYFLLQILNALSFSALLMLAGLGLSLVLSLMNFINLTHGSFFLLGGYISVQWLASGAPWWLAFPAAFALCGLMGLLLDRFPFRQFYQRTHLMQVLLTYGLSVILADLMRWGFSADTLSPMLPQVLRGGVWIMGLPFPTYRLFLIITGLTLALLFWFLLDRTLWGAAIRACVQDAQIVETLGLNSRRLFAIGMALAAGLAGLGGALGAGMLSVYPGLDEEILLLALLVVVIGGLNSVRGTLLCALILGFVTTFARVWVPAFANAATLAVMLALLLCWPNGLSKSATRQV